MDYQEKMLSASRDPQALEDLYREALASGEGAAFAGAVTASAAAEPDNLLFAAWRVRLAATAVQVKKRVVAWGWALPLGVLNGLILWLLSDSQRFSFQVTNPFTGQVYTLLPVLFLIAAPISAAFITLFLTLAGEARPGRAAAVIAALAAAVAYVWLLYAGIWPRLYQEQYLTLMVLHLVFLAWAGIGVVALARAGDAENRFAFLGKSLEAVVVGGLMAIAGGLLTGITFGLFDALGIQPPDAVARLFFAGGAGLIAIVAVALVYDPTAAPADQPADEGLSKLVALLMRLLLPLAVGVLLVYLAFIPFNWREPFENRDVLLIFNALLFAVLALLVGATPLREADTSARGQTWLRRGIMALAFLTLLVSLYAFAAILYRTANDRITPNRLAFIGWNVINIAILIILLIRQLRAGRPAWLPAMHRTFALGAVLYVVWSAAGLVALPWLFRGEPAWTSGLPASIQEFAYERPAPILLRCTGSEHIYLLEDGQKHWIKDIPTFQAEGYRWNDVITSVSCEDLRRVPDGAAIPPDAGPPPTP